MTFRLRFASLLCLPLVLAACGGADLTSGEPMNTGGTAGGGGSGGQPGAGAGGSNAGASGSGGSSTGGSAGSAGSTAGSAGAPGPTCSATDATPKDAMFVVPPALIQPGTPDGSLTRPFTSIADAIGAAAAEQKARVIVSAGTYAENIALNALSAALTIEGGWSFESSTWVHVCDATSDSYRPTIKGASSDTPTLHVSGTQTQVLTLHALRITTPASASAGQSQIAIHVTSSTVTLDDVDVVAGDAGDGQTPTTPPPAPGQIQCDGLTLCGPTDTNLDGNPGPEGAAPTTGGTFDTVGFTPASGLAGGQGEPGRNGTSGGTSLPITCFVCSTDVTNCKQVPDPGKTGTPGKCGCGGLGGNGGLPGGGGGASVGLLATSKATITITNSAITSGDGGDGAQGQNGGPSGDGSDGTPGQASDTCENDVNDMASCQVAASSTGNKCKAFNTVKTSSSGGAAGGKGGTGGPGGKGGPGAGGPSYAVVSIGSDVKIDEATTKLKHGNGGTGAKDAGDKEAPKGAEGEKLTQP